MLYQRNATARSRVCEVCGKGFVYRGQLLPGLGRFCSTPCKGVAQRAPLGEYRCEYCGQSFWRISSRSGQGRFCSRQCTFAARRASPEQFWARVDKQRLVPPGTPALGSCWLWLGGKNAKGYGIVNRLIWGQNLAHRVSFALTNGQIPNGQEIDHLCLTRACVRPDHLQLVPHRVNVLRSDNFAARNARKTHCAKGHAFTPENTLKAGKTGRRCATCKRGYSTAV